MSRASVCARFFYKPKELSSVSCSNSGTSFFSFADLKVVVAAIRGGGGGVS